MSSEIIPPDELQTNTATSWFVLAIRISALCVLVILYIVFVNVLALPLLSVMNGRYSAQSVERHLSTLRMVSLSQHQVLPNRTLLLSEGYDTLPRLLRYGHHHAALIVRSAMPGATRCFVVTCHVDTAFSIAEWIDARRFVDNSVPGGEYCVSRRERERLIRFFRGQSGCLQ